MGCGGSKETQLDLGRPAEPKQRVIAEPVTAPEAVTVAVEKQAEKRRAGVSA